jgi:conjugal transfer pilus assembly protein TraA
MHLSTTTLASQSGRNWLRFGLVFALTFLVLAVLSEPTFAATAGEEFSDLYTLLKGWCTGYLGKSIAISFILVGLGMGIIRGSIVAAVVCIAAAVALLMAPSVIDALFVAS